MQQAAMKNKAVEKTKPFYNSTIPSDWTTPEFGEVFSFLKSFSFSREQLTNEKTEDEIQNIHYGDIHATFENEILDFEIESRIPFVVDGLISKEVMSDEEFPLLKDGDLIIADASEDTVGVAECVELKNVNGRKIVSGLHTFAARDKNGKTVEGYRTYILNHPQVVRELRRIATGFSVFGVSKTNLSTVKLPLPPVKEQKQIADLLHLMDTTININESIVAKTELKKNWLMQNLLTGKIRVKGYNGEWKKTKLETVADIRRGASPRPIQDPKWFSEKGRGWIRISDVTSSHFYLNQTTQYLSDEGADKSVKVDKGDLIMSICATIGVPVIINIPACIHDGFVLFREYEKNLTTFFLYYFIQYKTEKLSGEGQPGTQKNLNTSIVGNIQLNLPSIEEQKAITQMLQATDKEIQFLKAKTEKLRKKKKGLMQQLLTGKKRLK